MSDCVPLNEKIYNTILLINQEFKLIDKDLVLMQIELVSKEAYDECDCFAVAYLTMHYLLLEHSNMLPNTQSKLYSMRAIKSEKVGDLSVTYETAKNTGYGRTYYGERYAELEQAGRRRNIGVMVC